MKRTILAVAVLSATLMFIIKLFETQFAVGELSIKTYITIIGIIFLSIGVWLGIMYGYKRNSKNNILPTQPISNTILTERETELLALVAQGLSNKEIADKVYVSENTVKKHLNNLYSKLGVARRTQAVSKAKELGIIT